MHLKFLEKYYWSPGNFDKSQVPLNDQTDTNFIAPLWMHF